MNDPFSGGSKRGGLLPPDVAGAIAAASTSVSSPAGGVNPGAPFFARNNQGSNIGVPYARLCPLSGKRSQMGLGQSPVASGPKGPVQVTETDDLRGTTMAFILGRRSQGQVGLAQSTNLATKGVPNTGFNEDTGFLDGDAVFDYGFNLAIHRDIAPGIPGTERFQKLCSFQYLQRYFTNVLPNKGINLSLEFGTGNTLVNYANGASWRTGLPSAVKDAVTRRTKLRNDSPAGEEDKVGTEIDMPAKSMLDMKDLCMELGMTGSKAATAQPIRQGIFARDTGPFLRGKGLSPGVLNGTASESAPQELPAQGGKPVPPVSPFHVSRCAGDELAFGLLERVMEANGLTDWRPDGIVLSKGVNDPSDKLSDEALEARDGQLFNVRIQGPAITSSWAGDPQLEVMPLDRVFVVIVADVWWGGLGDGALADVKAFVDKVAPLAPTTPGNATQPTQPTREELTKYMEARNALFSTSGGRLVASGSTMTAFADAAKAAFEKDAADAEETRLCNFRVELATSSQMVAYSQLRFDSAGKQVVGEFETADDQYRRVPNQSRMGLRLGLDGGEYIVGGWCIGSVLDTCASRAVMPNNAGSNIGVRTAPNSMAININVNVEWWDPDRMYRCFMNVDGTITPRYLPTKDKSAISAINRSPQDFPFAPSPNPTLVIKSSLTAAQKTANDKAVTDAVDTKTPALADEAAVKATYKAYLKNAPLAYTNRLTDAEVDALFS